MSVFTPPAAALAASLSTVGTLFSARVPVQPNHPAVVDGDRVLTYAQLEDRSNRLAQVLSRNGLERGDRVAILARNCLEYLETEIAAAKVGVIMAALNWRLGDRELCHCISLVAPKAILHHAEFDETLDRLDVGDIPRWAIGDGYEEMLDQASAERPAQQVFPEDGMIILYTSGTTGLPKGALISHRALIARSMFFASELEVPVGDNFVAWAPFYHMASTDQSLATLMRGGTVYVVDGFLPDRLIDLVETVPMRIFVLMPGTVGPFADAFTARRAKALDVGMCGAMADLVPRDHIAAATTCLEAPYQNSFGSTECGLPPASGAVIPIGVAPKSLPKRQSSFCEIRLVDANDVDTPQGVPGEVIVRGPTLFSGYWNAPETNEEEFRNGWFHTGDVMRRREDGTLDYVDRVKYMIKSGGENIYPAEIEQVLLGDARVTEAIVVRRKDEKWGEVSVAFVVANDPALTSDDLMQVCRSDLSRYKCPKDIFFLKEAELPRSTTGKIQRHLLEQRLESAE